jgi:hypothetical protein
MAEKIAHGGRGLVGLVPIPSDAIEAFEGTPVVFRLVGTIEGRDDATALVLSDQWELEVSLCRQCICEVRVP